MSRIRINQEIRARELRVISEEGANLGVLLLEDALKKARESGHDLIEISPNANPPIAKIMDIGKYLYLENKKQKQTKSKSHKVEVKSIQVKVGTGEHDLSLKAKQASVWLQEGNRVKINLFLPGRTKYMDIKFLNERLERLLKFITIEYKIAESPQKSPKGLTILIERGSDSKQPITENPHKLPQANTVAGETPTDNKV